jgi:hypothetical protein
MLNRKCGVFQRVTFHTLDCCPQFGKNRDLIKFKDERTF